MANISIAEGYVDINGSAKSVSSFIQLMERVQDWNHSLKLHVGYFDKKKLHEQLNENPDKIMNMNYRFTGFGRSKFINNLNDLMKDLERERSMSTSLNNNGLRVCVNNKDDWKVYEEIAWLRLNRYPVNLVFNYVDVEPGLEIVHDITAKLEWEPNKILQAKTTELYRNHCPFEAEAVYEIDETQRHQLFDATSFTVESINDNLDFYDFEWIDYLSHYFEGVELNLTDIGDLKSERHRNFIEQLGNHFDKIKEKNPKKIQTYVKIEDWYMDPFVKESIVNLLKI